MKTIEKNITGVTLRGLLHERLREEESFLRPAVLVLAGGAYEHRSKRETEPVMLCFLAKGYQAFTLDYTVGRENIALHEPEAEVNASLMFLRENAFSLDIDCTRIVLLGFSAGGHLALSSQCHYKSGRADALVLCYPVVTTGQFGHEGSTYNLTGGDEEKKEYYSLEKHIPGDLPPVFMWHTAEDEAVSPMNTILLAGALTSSHVPFEYHLFEKGRHGLSICTLDVETPQPRTQGWLDLLFGWLEETLQWKQ